MTEHRTDGDTKSGFSSFADLYASARRGRPRTVAVAAAHDADVMEAMDQVAREGIARGILVGDEARIRAIASAAGISLDPFRIVPAASGDEAAREVVRLARSGEADAIMKGHLSTKELLRAVLDREQGLRTGAVLSHVAVVEVSTYPKLLFATDGGINIEQDIETKRAIVANTVAFCQRYGIETPKVALLALVEAVDPRLPETEIAAAVVQAWIADGGDGAVVEGPVAMDVALSREAAEKKGVESRIAGEVDVLVGANITSTNHLVKSCLALGRSRVGGVIVGARVPIILLSRSDSAQTKSDSIVAAIASFDV